MEKEDIKISKEKVLAEYKQADSEKKALLENLFGKDLFVPKDVTEHIKTFEDAIKELSIMAEKGDEKAAMLLADYESNANNIKMIETIAYMKLCIVTYALNEGWEPQFAEGEYRYYPWFYLYTQEEIDRMNEDDKEQLLRVGGDANGGARCGISYASSHYGLSFSHASVSARLAFKTRELAKYAGTQFTEIWSAFVFKPAKKKEKK